MKHVAGDEDKQLVVRAFSLCRDTNERRQTFYRFFFELDYDQNDLLQIMDELGFGHEFKQQPNNTTENQT